MGSHSSELEDQIPILRELDKQRIEIEKFRDDGFKSLEKWLTDKDASGEPKNVNLLIEQKNTATVAFVIKAFYERSKEPPEESKKCLDKLIIYLNNLTLKDIINLPDIPSPLPPDTPYTDYTNPYSVLDAALVVQALVAVPGQAFSKTVFLCLYWVMREIYSVDYPDFGIGGARTSPFSKLTTSAFTTNECVKAITDFRSIFGNTARFFEYINQFKTTNNELVEMLNNTSNPIPKDWYNAEKKRLAHAYHTAQLELSGVIAFYLSNSPLNYISTSDYPSPYLTEVENVADEIINKSKAAVCDAMKEIDDFRKNENTIYGYSTSKIIQTEVSHRYVYEIILTDVEKNAGDALEAIKNSSHLPPWKELKNIFKKIDYDLYKFQHPAQTNYMLSVIDHEISVASSGERQHWDSCEMVCAAAAYSELSREWGSDQHLKRAVKYLTEAISERGMLPHSRPIHVDAKDGKMTFVYEFDILRTFAQLLKNMRLTNNVIQPDLVTKMLCFFKDTREYISSGELDKTPGWHYEYFPNNTFGSEATAKAILTLSMIHEMLNEQINNIVLDHFTVKYYPTDLEKKPNLNDLFYPDYGLGLFKDIKRPQNFQFSEWPEHGSFMREDSIAIELQKMRAHVICPRVRVGIGTSESDLCSLILHGPPGTGKTILVEALARTCKVNMVEVTPSDIVVKGEEAIERRARAVFEALSLLTRTIILFDEFDPVLWHRDPYDSSTRNVFSFLTPGMLPKLKALNDRAKRQSVAYILVTNIIGSLDAAAIREGRFDKKMGIYPPDVLSRLGRFVSQYNKMSYKSKPTDFEKRVIDVLKRTSGAPMQILTKPGWFTKPKQDIITIDQPEAEAQIGQIIGEGKAAIKEYVQWWWINQWDENVRNNRTINKFDQIIEQIPKPEEEIEDLRMSLFNWKKEKMEQRK